MRRTNRHALAAGVATLALVTAACGGTDGSAPAAEGAPATQDVAADPADDTDDGHVQTAPDTAAEPDDHDDTAQSDDHDDTAESDDHDDTTTDDQAEASTVAVDRTVDVEMSEFAFTPADLRFEAGETVRFVFTNIGDAPHEAVLGDAHVQDEHETAMAEGMDDHSDDGEDEGGHHGDIPSVTVDPGETGEFVHTFSEAGELMLGCHLPGHWNAGMQASLDVAA